MGVKNSKTEGGYTPFPYLGVYGVLTAMEEKKASIIFADRLREVLKLRRYRQNEIAEILGVSNRTTNSYVRGNSEPSLDRLVEICKLLDVSADYLLGITDEFRTFDGNTDPIEDEVKIIRRSYESMDENKRKTILSLFEDVLKP